MRYYELLYIVNPNLEDDRVKNIIDEIGNEINKYKVSIINHNMWGKKRLAYPINNNKYGIYLLLQFSTEEFGFLKDFERFLILDKSVIRHQLVRLDEEPAKFEAIELVVEDKDSSEKESLEIPDGENTKIDLKDTEEEGTIEAENVDEEKSEGEQETKEEGE